jgi:uncharacterized lipoprotein YddW (UPF0748 family)
MKTGLFGFCLACLIVGLSNYRAAASVVEEASYPAIAREFRGVWVASVANIDWPTKRGLSSREQRLELQAILDRAKQLHLNAVILQVRPACDALYPSQIEPWSEFLTGKMGRAPEPFYDPLEFAITEAHRRGLELHAWFNPFRASHPSFKAEISPSHVSRRRPDLVKRYGRYLWLDPARKEVQDYSIRVIMDVVRRYDVDGVHLDDYFYPYRERDARGNLLDFPDQDSWQAYQRSGGRLSRDDWRRENVNAFIRRLYGEIKRSKPWVKFGVSPFGIWRPGNPPGIQGMDAYAQIYADSRLWFNEGWLDYFAPQLYWRIDQPAQSYAALLRWWTQQNGKRRHLWPGSFTSRVGGAGPNSWPSAEIVQQVLIAREQEGAGGSIHFSMRALMENRGGIAERLLREVYSQPALIPASPWLGRSRISAPMVHIKRALEDGQIVCEWDSSSSDAVRLWTVRVKIGDEWTVSILPRSERSLKLSADLPLRMVVVSAVDRLGQESGVGIKKLKQ